MEARCLLSSLRDDMFFKKGQYFSFDAIVASVIFILALVSLLSYWHSLRTALDSQTNDLAREALRISDMLLTPGHPEGARCNAMDQLGLSMGWQDRRVNKTKFDCAGTLDEVQLRNKLHTPFNISIIVDEAPAAAIGDDIRTIGNPKQVAKVRRVVAILNESGQETIAAFDIYLYQ